MEVTGETIKAKQSSDVEEKVTVSKDDSSEDQRQGLDLPEIPLVSTESKSQEAKPVSDISSDCTVQSKKKMEDCFSMDNGEMEQEQIVTSADIEMDTLLLESAGMETSSKPNDFPTEPRIKTPIHAAVVTYQESVKREQNAESTAVVQIANSSLSLLTQYDSCSDSDITDSEDQNGKKNAEPGTSDSESSSDESVIAIQNMDIYRTNQNEAILISDAETAPTEANDSDGDLFSSGEEDPLQAPEVRTKGERLINELPPIEDLQITVPEEACKPIGHVESIVAQIVIVQSYAGVELLNLDTVLFLEKGKRTLGKIFDVIGQVMAPMYCVLFNSRAEVLQRGIKVGMPVFCAPATEHTSFIILSEVMKNKGSDASWLDDDEAPYYALDYSDDEQERAARKQRRGNHSTNRSNDSERGQPYNGPRHRGRGGRGHSKGRHRSGNSWHHNLPATLPPPSLPSSNVVVNPFAIAALGVMPNYAFPPSLLLPPPPPPPPPPLPPTP